MKADYEIRQETEKDYPQVFKLVEEAFRDMEESDHREQFLVERLRHSPAFEIIKVRKMWVKRKMQKNTTITLCFNRLQSN